jgi:hypothetical protein
MGTALNLYMYMMFVPHRKHTYRFPGSVTEIALLSLYVANVHISQDADVDDVRTSQETPVSPYGLVPG